ncbi:hypothetical protein CRM22_008538 [Opisthorchis felineus]|uniref:Uncharacterized protein n=1 Tax=Opisthorchis felineus TaxID=147828 RepID=A0A4S2LAN5_OPIFE|nr:hypothetical protein CRM22_008538 [Opisthorchis felineus]
MPQQHRTTSYFYYLLYCSGGCSFGIIPRFPPLPVTAYAQDYFGMPKQNRKRNTSEGAKDKATSADEEFLRKLKAEKQSILNNELSSVSMEIERARGDIQELRKKIIAVDQLIADSGSRNNEYLCYFAKKFQLRAEQPVTLNEFHEKNIQVLEEKRHQMLEEYALKTKDLLKILEEQSQKLRESKDKLASMDELKMVCEEQEDELARLEKENDLLRAQYAKRIGCLGKDLDLKYENLRLESEARIRNTNDEAPKEALCLVLKEAEETYGKSCELRQEIIRMNTSIKEMGHEMEKLVLQNAEFRRNRLYLSDLSYLEHCRLNGIQKMTYFTGQNG